MPTRRTLLAAALAVATVRPGDAAVVGADLAPGPGDRTEAFRTGLARAIAENRPFVLAPGTYRLKPIALPDGARIEGTAGLTTLVLVGEGTLLSAGPARRIGLAGLAFDGRNQAAGPGGALLAFADVADLRLTDCVVGRAGGIGILAERCGGRIERCTLGAIGSYALLSRDGRAMTVADTTVTDCGEGGILVHRSEPGEDGAVIRGCRVERIRAASGGTGQVGNGINVFRADDVAIVDNRVTDCAFSGIRVNAGSDVRILGNEVLRSGETALYVEFAFQGAVVANNVIDGAANGISIVNFMQGGRLATVSGNVVRNLRSTGPYPPGRPGFGFGIAVEADTAVTGNVVEGAPLCGILAGWGAYQRDLTISSNVVRKAGFGVLASVAEGAGAVVIVGNVFAETKGGAVVGHRLGEPATGDLTLSGAAIPPPLKVEHNHTGG